MDATYLNGPDIIKECLKPCNWWNYWANFLKNTFKWIISWIKGVIEVIISVRLLLHHKILKIKSMVLILFYPLGSVLWKMVENCHVHENRKVGRSHVFFLLISMIWNLWHLNLVMIYMYLHCFWNAKVILPNVFWKINISLLFRPFASEVLDLMYL